MAANHESLTDLNLSQMVSASHGKQVILACVSAFDTKTGYGYEFGFVPAAPTGSYLVITTEERRKFLQKGTEQQAQVALVDMAQRTRSVSGGFFGIHCFEGAVDGTALTPLYPNFNDPVEPNEDLRMTIYLKDEGWKFDPKLTRMAKRIGNTFTVPGPEARLDLKYASLTFIGNPNQRSRDQAINNGLGEAWNAEFKKYNGVRPVDRLPLREYDLERLLKKLKVPGLPKAIRLTPDTIVEVMESLQDKGITEVLVTKLNLSK